MARVAVIGSGGREQLLGESAQKATGYDRAPITIDAFVGGR